MDMAFRCPGIKKTCADINESHGDIKESRVGMALHSLAALNPRAVHELVWRVVAHFGAAYLVGVEDAERRGIQM